MVKSTDTFAVTLTHSFVGAATSFIGSINFRFPISTEARIVGVYNSTLLQYAAAPYNRPPTGGYCMLNDAVPQKLTERVQGIQITAGYDVDASDDLAFLFPYNTLDMISIGAGFIISPRTLLELELNVSFAAVAPGDTLITNFLFAVDSPQEGASPKAASMKETFSDGRSSRYPIQ